MTSDFHANATRPIRLGLAGHNWGARVAEALRGVSEVTIAACHARKPAAREAFATRFACRACATWEELIADESLHGLVIMTPNGTHRDLAVAAMRAGRHVLVTKPIATTLPDALDMICVSRETERILAVGHQSRRHPAMRTLKQLIAAGALGPPRLIEGNASSPTGLTVQPGHWRSQAAECPGGPLLQLGIHYVDNFQHLLGPAHTVSAWLGKIGGGAVEPDMATLLLGFDSGAAGYLGSSYVTSHARWIRVAGEKGTALFQGDGSLVLQHEAGGEPRAIVAPAGDREAVLRQMLAEEITEFAECIRTGKEPEIGGEAATRNLAVVLAAVESHRRGAPVDVNNLLKAEGLSQCMRG